MLDYDPQAKYGVLSIVTQPRFQLTKINFLRNKSFACVGCYTSEAQIVYLRGSDIKFYHGVQNLRRLALAFQWEGVMFCYALHNGELLFSLPSLLNGPHHSNMWQWSIWMSLTRAALRSGLHSPHSLNRSNWIKETGGVREPLVKQTKGLLTSPMTLYLPERLRELCHLQSNLPLWWCKNK